MEEIFGRKRNVHPELLLDTSAMHTPITPQKKEACIEGSVLGVMEKEVLETAIVRHIRIENAHALQLQLEIKSPTGLIINEPFQVLLEQRTISQSSDMELQKH
nr:unnamed protein product [Callosobruchus analis]